MFEVAAVVGDLAQTSSGPLPPGGYPAIVWRAPVPFRNATVRRRDRSRCCSRGTGQNRPRCGSRFRAADLRISARLTATGDRPAANRSTIRAVHRSRQSAARPRRPRGCGPGAPILPAPLRISRSPAASTPPHRRAGDRRLRRTTFADPGWSGSHSSPNTRPESESRRRGTSSRFLTEVSAVPRARLISWRLPASRYAGTLAVVLIHGWTASYRRPERGANRRRQILDRRTLHVGELREITELREVTEFRRGH